MNRSIVISRYATALVKYVGEEGCGEAVCSEAERLRSALQNAPGLQEMLSSSDDVVSAEDKKKLLVSALGGSVSEQMDRYLDLLVRSGRTDMTADILRSFTDAYYRARGVRKAHLTAVSEPSAEFLESLRELVRHKTGDDVRIEVDVDPGLIGGFVFDIDDYLLDGSVRRQLELIREKFIEWNKRII